MKNITTNKTFSNCKVSRPILYPDQQHVAFNGFAWSYGMGMVHQINNEPQQDWTQWLGTQQ